MRTRSIPFGYEVVGGRYVVNNGEAEIISSIYSMYLSGKTLLGIAEALTEQEVTYFEDTKGLIANFRNAGFFPPKKQFQA